MVGKTDQADKKSAGKPDRQARLKAALKSNMAKRKAQARARASSGKSDEGSPRD